MLLPMTETSGDRPIAPVTETEVAYSSRIPIEDGAIASMLLSIKNFDHSKLKLSALWGPRSS